MQTTEYAEGKVLAFEGVECIDSGVLEAFPYEGYEQLMRYTTGEFSAVCPFSGLPDIATISIEYVPSDKCIELKSLKYYFLSYRNVGIYQEAATNQIFSDLWSKTEPKYLRVETVYNTRGGIDAECSIEKGMIPQN